DPIYAAAHIAKLWTWALTSAPDGDLGQLEPEVIARAALWRRDAAAFVDARTAVGFFDRDEGGSLQLHGWRERYDRWLSIQEGSPDDRQDAKRRAHADAQAEYRRRQRGDVGDRGDDERGDGRVIGGAVTRDRQMIAHLSSGDVTGD